MVAVVLAFAVLMAIATYGETLLPPLIDGGGYSAPMRYVGSTFWALCLIALALLWRQRSHSVLDVWLMVVLFASMCDMALSAILNSHRFDLGFYAGRLYGLLGAAFILLLMMIETAKMYTRLASLLETERDVSRRENTQLRHLARSHSDRRPQGALSSGQPECNVDSGL